MVFDATILVPDPWLGGLRYCFNDDRVYTISEQEHQKPVFFWNLNSMLLPQSQIFPINRVQKMLKTWGWPLSASFEKGNFHVNFQATPVFAIPTCPCEDVCNANAYLLFYARPVLSGARGIKRHCTCAWKTYQKRYEGSVRLPTSIDQFFCRLCLFFVDFRCANTAHCPWQNSYAMNFLMLKKEESGRSVSLHIFISGSKSSSKVQLGGALLPNSGDDLFQGEIGLHHLFPDEGRQVNLVTVNCLVIRICHAQPPCDRRRSTSSKSKEVPGCESQHGPDDMPFSQFWMSVGFQVERLCKHGFNMV